MEDEINGKYSGWTAQIIQHEIDHRNGIVIKNILFTAGKTWKSGTVSAFPYLKERMGRIKKNLKPDIVVKKLLAKHGTFCRPVQCDIV